MSSSVINYNLRTSMYSLLLEGVLDQGAEAQQGWAKGDRITEMHGCSARLKHGRGGSNHPGEGLPNLRGNYQGRVGYVITGMHLVLLSTDCIR